MAFLINLSSSAEFFAAEFMININSSKVYFLDIAYFLGPVPGFGDMLSN